MAVSANRLELLQIADAVAREKSIDRMVVIEAMQDAMEKAAKGRYGAETEIKVEINPRSGETRMWRLLERFDGGRMREVLTVSVVGTFAVGWLLGRMADFSAAHGDVDLRVLTNNNKVDLAGESLDYAIRFGDGAWHGVEADKIMDAPFTPLCAPATAAKLRTAGRNSPGTRSRMSAFRRALCNSRARNTLAVTRSSATTSNEAASRSRIRST